MKIIENVSADKDFLPNDDIDNLKMKLLKEAYTELSTVALLGKCELSEYACRYRKELENLLDDQGMVILDKLLWCVIELERNALWP